MMVSIVRVQELGTTDQLVVKLCSATGSACLSKTITAWSCLILRVLRKLDNAPSAKKAISHYHTAVVLFL